MQESAENAREVKAKISYRVQGIRDLETAHQSPSAHIVSCRGSTTRSDISTGSRGLDIVVSVRTVECTFLRFKLSI